MKQKTFFIVFEGLAFGEKNKNLIKNSGHKLEIRRYMGYCIHGLMCHMRPKIKRLVFCKKIC